MRRPHRLLERIDLTLVLTITRECVSSPWPTLAMCGEDRCLTVRTAQRTLTIWKAARQMTDTAAPPRAGILVAEVLLPDSVALAPLRPGLLPVPARAPLHGTANTTMAGSQQTQELHQNQGRTITRGKVRARPFQPAPSPLLPPSLSSLNLLSQ